VVDVDAFELRFPGLADVLERSELTDLLGLLTVRDVSAGELVITEGTPTDALFLVHDGGLCVSIQTPEGELELGEVERGAYLGEVSLLDPGSATASVRADQPATVLLLGHSELRAFAAAHPTAAAILVDELARGMIHRVRARIRDLAQAELPAGPEAVSPMPLGLADALDALPGLRDLPAADRDGIRAAFSEHRFAANSLVAEAGTRLDGLQIVLEGTVTRRIGDGKHLGVELGPGAIVSPESLRGVVLTDVVAETPVTTAVVAGAALAGLLAARADLAAAVGLAGASQLARDLRLLTEASRALPAPSTAEVTTDVAVIGAGPNGLAYAWFVKEGSPSSRVTVLERRDVPGYKIGESTLGTTTRGLRRLGLDLPVMRRLFGIKSGIRFWWTAAGSRQLLNHVDAGDVDETFQVERRVLETALLATARRRGIDVRTATRVNMAESSVSGESARLRCEPDRSAAYDLVANVVCDASGPASVLPRRLGTFRKDPGRLATFNANAYYAYYRQTSDVPLPLWDLPATRHICFPEGWCWFISVVSWEGTPQENLEAMIEYLVDYPQGPDETYPSRQELEKRFGCTSETILSVGFTVREDLDGAAGLPVDARFNHYLERYPAIADILAHYELIEEPYQKRQPYSAFQKMAHDSQTVAGDRWCAIGDAAAFSNPLFSPGLTFGTGTAHEAAVDTIRALRSGDASREGFRAYQHYAERTHEILMGFNDMLYRSFAHPDSFERALLMFFFHSAADVTSREAFSETDPYVWDMLNPEFGRRVDEIRHILRAAEERGSDPADVVPAVRAVTDAYIAKLASSPALAEVDIPTALREFTQQGERAPERETRAGLFTALRCGTCRLWSDSTLAKCPICGTPTRPAPAAS
jgi:flavin-dependent dehydrogenase/CRP-like cAMP-binding protein